MHLGKLFSEKFEAIIYLDEINGRMKDFYDCYKLIESNVLNKMELKAAIMDTFKTRGTEPGLIPENLIKAHEHRWIAFLKKEKLGQLDLANSIGKINQFLKELKI